MELKNNNFTKIQFGDKEYYIVDHFEYKGIKYYYIIEDLYIDGKDNLEDYSNTSVEVNFIYKADDEYYQTVNDDKLYEQLTKLVTKRIYLQENKYFKGIYNNNQ